MDELNVIVSMYGSSCEVSQIITQLDHVGDTKIIDNLPVGSIICPRKLCCNNIVRYVRAMQNQAGAAVTIHSIAGGQAEAMEFIVDEHTMHCGEPLKTLKLKKNILIVCITRHGKIEIPNGDSRFFVGDSVVVVDNRSDVILQLNDIFE
jgi:trk system potassium uptake protein TrkA